MSKKYIASLVLVLCLLVLFFPTPVKGQNSPLIEECESMLEVWVEGNHSSQPYVGCYMTTNYLGEDQTVGDASAVHVTVSFDGTDTSVIQNDNWLMAGIATQGPDSVHGDCYAIDWGYTFSLWVAPYLSQPYFHATVFQGHEWIHCLPGYAKSIYSWNTYVPSLTIDSSVTLTMQWTDETLDYYAEVDGTTWLLNQYTPNETAIHCFKTGIQGRKWGPLPLPNTVKFLQFFGAWSEYDIGCVGWESELSAPGYIKLGDSSWTDVSFAYSTDGENSYWDNTLGWGGDCYENVDANYYCKHVHFYPTSDGTTLETDTLLWACHTLSISTTSGGTTSPAPGTYTYSYGEAVTVTATAYYGYGFDYWVLDGGMYMQNPIEITMDQPHTLEAHFKSTSGGGGGGGSCPTLFVWNGTAYVEEGILDIHAESDVTVQHWIQNTLALENGVYNLQLWELDNNTSHIDQVKLYAVDSEGEWHLCPLTYAYHSELGKVKHTLRFDDDNRVDLNPTETINLKFAEAECETTCFIFEINGYNRKTHT